MPVAEGRPEKDRNEREEIERKTLAGSGWTLLGHTSGEFLRLFSNLVLTRLLVPEAFGLMALVNVFVQGLTMFSDVGIGPSIVRSKRGDDPAFLGTAFSLQAVRGLLLMVACGLLAPAVAAYYDTEQILHMLPVVGLSALLDGFHSTAIFVLNRDLRMRRFWVLRLAGQVAGVGTMIAWAWIWPSVWALVAGRIATSGTVLFLSHVAGGSASPRFRWERVALDELIRFGRWVFPATALSFLATQMDRLALGKLLPNLGILGIYHVSLVLAQMPTLAVHRLCNDVVFPSLAALSRQDPSTLFHETVRARRPLLQISGVMVLGLAVGGELFFTLLYDPRYRDAGWMSELLSLWAWPTLLRISADRSLVVLGDVRAVAIANATAMICGLAGMIVGYRTDGMSGAILGIAVGATASHAVTLLALQRHGLPLWRQDLRATLLFLGGLAACLFAADSLRSALGPRWSFLHGVPVLALLLVALWILGRRLLRQRRR